jgi:hypothetical protein
MSDGSTAIVFVLPAGPPGVVGNVQLAQEFIFSFYSPYLKVIESRETAWRVIENAQQAFGR